jgi:hypothetical protein
VVTIAVVLSACTQATGMGWIPSSGVPTEKATFGFVFDGTTGTLSGSFHDRHGLIAGQIIEVAFKGTGVMKPKPPPPDLGDYGCVWGTNLSYDSQNPNVPGSGTFVLVVCDFDHFTQPSPTKDFIFITVDSGPYLGYHNEGLVQGGNITVT